MKVEGTNVKIINLADLLGNSNKEASRVLADLFDVADCGNSECPIHGDGDAESGIITADDLDHLDAEQTLELSLSAASAASNFLARKDRKAAEVFQTQAMLWLRISEIKERREAKAKSEPVETEQPQDGAPEA